MRFRIVIRCRVCGMGVSCIEGAAIDREQCCDDCMKQLAKEHPQLSWGEIKREIGWE